MMKRCTWSGCEEKGEIRFCANHAKAFWKMKAKERFEKLNIISATIVVDGKLIQVSGFQLRKKFEDSK